MDNRPIGVFDSGVGGLTVVRELKKELPGENVVYFGDLARLPYGSKSKENIITYSRQIIRFLEKQDVKAVIIACGTASANALPTVRGEFALPVMGVVEPGARAAVAATESGRIGIIGTSATVRSGEYPRLIGELAPGAEVRAKACPLFVPLAEEEELEVDVAAEVARVYLKELKEAGVDTLVLGCTHYPLLAELIGAEMGPRVRLVNPSRAAVLEAKEFLAAKGLLARRKQGSCRFYVTDNTEHFESLAMRILDVPMTPTEKVPLAELWKLTAADGER